MRIETIGDATLYLGDCLDVLPTLGDESVEMIWTDPPYGHENAGGKDFLSKRHEIMGDGRKTASIKIKNDSRDSMRAVVDAMLTEAVRVLRSDSCCCCCCCGGGGGGPQPTFAWLANRMDDKGLSFFHSVIWDKNNPGVGWRYRRQHEMIMIAHRKGGKLSWNKDHPAISNIIKISKPRDKNHPNEKPLALIEKMILAHTLPGDTVLDPFMGSGTTGVAAIKHGRKFIGIEFDAGYFDVSLSRIVGAQSNMGMFA